MTDSEATAYLIEMLDDHGLPTELTNDHSKIAYSIAHEILTQEDYSSVVCLGVATMFVNTVAHYEAGDH